MQTAACRAHYAPHHKRQGASRLGRKVHKRGGNGRVWVRGGGTEARAAQIDIHESVPFVRVIYDAVGACEVVKEHQTGPITHAVIFDLYEVANLGTVGRALLADAHHVGSMGAYLGAKRWSLIFSFRLESHSSCFNFKTGF